MGLKLPKSIAFRSVVKNGLLRIEVQLSDHSCPQLSEPLTEITQNDLKIHSQVENEVIFCSQMNRESFKFVSDRVQIRSELGEDLW